MEGMRRIEEGKQGKNLQSKKGTRNKGSYDASKIGNKQAKE